MKRTFHANDRLLILNGGTGLQQIISNILPTARMLAAPDYDSALKLMVTYKISVVICDIADDYPAALAFFIKLKQQYPQTVSIILAEHAESGVMVDLIKQAQVYRYMFKPLKMRLMARYLEAALQHGQKSRATPEEHERQVEEIKPVATARFASSAPVLMAEGVQGTSKQSGQLNAKKVQRLFRRFILQQDYS